MSKAIFAIVILFFVAIATAKVVTLTPDNIDSVLGNDAGGILVKFYAPWCGHCKNLAPEFEAAAELLEGTGVTLAEADCDAHKLIGEQYHITGYPTLKWFMNKQVIDYNGGRGRSEIVTWVKKIILSTLEEVTSKEQLESRKPSGSVYGLVVLYGSNPQFAEEFLNTAKALDDIQFVHVKSADLIAEEGATDGTARLYKQDGTHIDYAADTENIINEITIAAYPKYVEFSQSQFYRLSQTKDLIIFGFAPFDDQEKLDLLFSYFNDAADAHKNVGFVYGNSKIFERGLSGAGASMHFLPTVVAIRPNIAQLVWDEDIPLNSQSLIQWISQVFEGTAPTNRKSELVPESNDGPVVKLVYKNYNKFLNLGKPIFVKYYAPWCGHCKSMAADWIKLGQTVSKDQVIIAEYDATANYSEVETIEGFPTLVFYNGKGGKVVYQGDRSFDDLLRFVNSQLGSHSHDEL